MVMGSTSGLITVSTKEISNRASGMVMASGKIKMRSIRDIIALTRRKVSEFICGRINRFTRESSRMTFDRAMDSSSH